MRLVPKINLLPYAAARFGRAWLIGMAGSEGVRVSGLAGVTMSPAPAAVPAGKSADQAPEIAHALAGTEHVRETAEVAAGKVAEAARGKPAAIKAAARRRRAKPAAKIAAQSVSVVSHTGHHRPHLAHHGAVALLAHRLFHHFKHRGELLHLAHIFLFEQLGVGGTRSKREGANAGEGNTQLRKCVHGIAFFRG